jgi:microcystin-dependent protein
MAEPYVGAPGGGFAQGTGYDAYPNQSSSAQNANITINNATTSISTQNTGGGQAMNNMPPYCGLNFIIRYQ